MTAAFHPDASLLTSLIAHRARVTLNVVIDILMIAENTRENFLRGRKNKKHHTHVDVAFTIKTIIVRSYAVALITLNNIR